MKNTIKIFCRPRLQQNLSSISRKIRQKQGTFNSYFDSCWETFKWWNDYRLFFSPFAIGWELLGSSRSAMSKITASNVSPWKLINRSFFASRAIYIKTKFKVTVNFEFLSRLREGEVHSNYIPHETIVSL